MCRVIFILILVSIAITSHYAEVFWRRTKTKGKNIIDTKSGYGGGMSGRPRKYKTSADLEEAIDKYFRDAAYDENGVKKKNQDPLTITGLALHLGFESRQSIFDYMKNEEFAHAIKSQAQDRELS